MKRFCGVVLLALTLWASVADALVCGVWAIKRGDRISKEFNGDQAGFAAALAYVGTSSSMVVVYPGCGGINVGATDLPDSVLVVRYDGGHITYYSNSPANNIFELSEGQQSNFAKGSWSSPSLALGPSSKILWREYQTPFTLRAFIEKDTNNVATVGCTNFGPIDLQPNNVKVMRVSSTGVRIGDATSPSTPLDVNGAATFRSAVNFGTPATLADNTTPSVSGGTVFKCTPASPTTITTFTGATAGQIIRIIFTNGNATLSDSGTLKLSSGSALTADDTITLLYDGTNFYELARSTN